MLSLEHWHAGGVFGLYSALTDGGLSSYSEAVAQGNGLGKGPLVFELYRSGVDLIRQQAAGELSDTPDATALRMPGGYSDYASPLP